MWELDHKESWALKKSCFQTVVLEKTLESLWILRRSNQSMLKEINPEYSVEGLMLKLEFQYFGHLMRRTNSLGKTLKLGKIEGRRRRGDRGWVGWMALSTQWTYVLSKFRETVKDKEAWCAAVRGVTKSWTQLSDRTTATRLRIQILLNPSYRLLMWVHRPLLSRVCGWNAWDSHSCTGKKKEKKTCLSLH